MFFMILIMIPLATTEIGTDGWITGIMERRRQGQVPPRLDPGLHVGDHAGPAVLRRADRPLALAAGAAGDVGGPGDRRADAAVRRRDGSACIFVAATLYGFGKTFFWPTMLGVVSDQTPRGGALTLNALGGIGMLAVGVLGFPYIGTLQADKKIDAIAATPAAQAAPGPGRSTASSRRRCSTRSGSTRSSRTRS